MKLHQDGAPPIAITSHGRFVMRRIRLCGALLAAPAILAGQVSRRTIEFTTTEGTWMSPDVSRDGRTIVFDVVGELYTVPREGGSATRSPDR